MDKHELFITAITGNESLIQKIASFYTRSTEDRNDLVQEIVYQLWKSFHTYDEKAKLSTWMYRVAMNTAIYHLRTSKRAILTVPLEENMPVSHEFPRDEQQEQWQVFKQHVNALNLLDKGILMLYLEEKSYQEIAEITGMSVSNVGTKLSRIREKLKQKIAKK